MTTPASVLSLRETEVVRWLASLGRAHTAQIERCLFAGSQLTVESRRVTANLVIRSLRQRGHITPTPKLVGGTGGGSVRSVYELTARGYRLAAAIDPALVAPRGARRSSIFLEHTLMTADVALAFHECSRRNPGHRLVEWAPDWQAAELIGRRDVRPDGLIRYSTGRWDFDAFVEVDRDTERPSRFAAKVRAYLDVYASGTWRAELRVWPLVLVVAPTTARAVQLRRTTEEVLRSERKRVRLGAAVEFDFAAIDDVRGEAGPLGAIWQVAERGGPHALISDDDGAEDPAAGRGGDELAAAADRAVGTEDRA